jgi:hypothetical protein
MRIKFTYNTKNLKPTCRDQRGENIERESFIKMVKERK